MSVLQAPVQQLVEINAAVATDTATDIVDATKNAVLVAWFEVNEHAGSTPDLTVAIYDGTNSRYLGDDGGSTWNAKTVTAKQSVKFSKGYVIPTGSKLQVTSSDGSGNFHVHGLKVRSN